jgi:hypothetical protein
MSLGNETFSFEKSSKSYKRRCDNEIKKQQEYLTWFMIVVARFHLSINLLGTIISLWKQLQWISGVFKDSNNWDFADYWCLIMQGFY